tara:strand:- start:3087 stop:3440 length:354 start_codon:yes stop_codon:yes gene_type:complete
MTQFNFEGGLHFPHKQRRSSYFSPEQGIFHLYQIIFPGQLTLGTRYQRMQEKDGSRILREIIEVTETPKDNSKHFEARTVLSEGLSEPREIPLSDCGILPYGPNSWNPVNFLIPDKR